MMKRNILLLVLAFWTIQNGHSQAIEANLLGQWSDPDLVGSNAFDNTYNEIWGIERNGHEYAIIGTTLGTHFIDVTDPSNIFEAFLIEGKATGGQIIHRDYHDYQDYIYAVADEGASSLQILDISDLPNAVTVAYDSDELFRTVHNIYIDTAKAKLYTLATGGGPQGFSAMRIYDLSNPLDPVLVDARNSFEGYTVGHVHDAFVQNDTAYLNCGGNGLVIAEFSDVSNPTVISILTSAEYPQAGYNHSGWLSDDGRYYFMADETHGTDLKVFDLIDPRNPELVTTFDAESSESNSIPHNLIFHCDRLYVSYYYDGLQVYDIGADGMPIRAEYYDTYDPTNNNSYKGAWGVYPFLPSGNVLISDMQTGLYVFEGDGEEDCQQATTSIVDNFIGDLKVWPTILSEGVINIENGNSQNILKSVTISSAAGQLISTHNWQKGQSVRSISIPAEMTSGIYILNIVAADGRMQTQRFVITN